MTRRETSRAPARRIEAAAPARAGTAISAKLTGRLAQRFGVDPTTFLGALRDTVFNPGKNRDGKPNPPFADHELAAALTICEKYDLNPFTREIYVTRNRGILLTIVPIDGWAKIANRQADYDGCEFEYEDRDNTAYSCTCRIFRKDRSRPTEVTEFFEECYRDTEPWNKWPKRMLRHKAFIQAVRLAYALSEAVDDDEASRMGMREPEYVVREEIPAAVEAPPREPAREVEQDAPPAEAVPDPDEDTEEAKALKAQLLAEFRGLQLDDAEYAEVRKAAGIELVNTRCTLAELEAVIAKGSELVQGRKE